MSKLIHLLPVLALFAGFAPLAASAAQTPAQGQSSQTQTTNGGQAEAGGY